MNIIDNDLLSMQEARILVENAVEARSEIRNTTKKYRQEILSATIKYFENNLEDFVETSCKEIDYGKIEDEIALGNYYLKNIREELKKFPQIGKVVKNEYSLGEMVGIPKGIVVAKLNLCLPILTCMEAIILAIHTANPIIIIPHKACVDIIRSLVIGLNERLGKIFYHQAAISALRHVSERGEKELLSSGEIGLVLEALLYEDSARDKYPNIEWFSSNLGNNVVFVEKTGDLDKAAKDIVKGKSFNNGLLPGVEQAVIVEKEIFVAFKLKLQKEGAYFLSDDEQERLEGFLYDKNFNPRRETIGLSALDIGKIGGIKLPDSTKILVVTRPYVSINSPYSKEKYSPILSFYIEDDWMEACEKCIELILNDKKGQSLSIYTSDPYVMEQFIEKKPVARVLVNESTGFGSIGLTSNFPLNFFLSTKQTSGISCKSLTPSHLMYFREIGVEMKISRDLLDDYKSKNKFEKDNLFTRLLEDI